MPDPRYGPRRLGHVNLFVSDCNETCAFLSEVCGLEMTGIMPKSGSAFFSNGNTHHDIGFIELAGYRRFKASRPYIQEPESRGKAVGLNHFGWEMEHEKALVDAYFRTIHGSGYPTPRITNNGTAYSNYVFDVDGVQHQLYADNLKDWRTVYTGGEVSLHRPPEWEPGRVQPSTERNYNDCPEIRRNEAAPLHPMRLSHATMVSDCIEKTLDFYDRFLGLVCHPTSLAGVKYLSGYASSLDVILIDGSTAALEPGIQAITFEVWPHDDLKESYRRLTTLGHDTAIYLSLPHKTSVFIRSPDGMLFEFSQRSQREPPVTATPHSPSDLLRL